MVQYEVFHLMVPAWLDSFRLFTVSIRAGKGGIKLYLILFFGVTFVEVSKPAETIPKGDTADWIFFNSLSFCWIQSLL